MRSISQEIKKNNHAIYTVKGTIKDQKGQPQQGLIIWATYKGFMGEYCRAIDKIKGFLEVYLSKNVSKEGIHNLTNDFTHLQDRWASLENEGIF